MASGEVQKRLDDEIKENQKREKEHREMTQQAAPIQKPPQPYRMHRVDDPNTKGVMARFLKTYGTKPQEVKSVELFQTTRVVLEPGQAVRNGFVSAEEKIRRDLEESTRRDEELRNERGVYY